MNRLILLLALSLLASCVARRDVHLFNRGYSAAEVAAVAAALREAGFRPRPNALEVPESIDASSIIYPAIVRDFAEIDRLQRSLAAAGIAELELIYETRAAHFYTTENIGLYLVDPDYTEAEPAAGAGHRDGTPGLSHVYYSNCEDVDAELSLFGQSTAILELLEWNERTGRERSTVVDGQWSSTGSSVSFEPFDGGRLVFEFSEFDGRDDYGRFYGIDLISSAHDSELPRCDFRFISYDSRTTLNRI